MAPPSIFDTHCDGPGLLPTTREWSFAYCMYRKYLSDFGTYIAHPDPGAPENDLRGKTVIISGANSGIGKEAALAFARCGASLVLACRFTAAHEQHPDETVAEIQAQVPGAHVEAWEIDCASMESVAAFGERWARSGRQCDILVNNAGLAAGKRVITDEGFELTYAINFLSHALLTFYVLPSMRKSLAPRIINTCSIFHSGGHLDFANMNNEKHTSGSMSGVQWYCDTKLYLLMWSVELQERLSRSNDYRHVIVHGIHPGVVGSNIWKNPDLGLFLLRPLLDALIGLVAVNPHQGAVGILAPALDPAFGLPASVLQPAKDKDSVPQPLPGVSAKFGGKFVNRNRVDIRRPEVDDPLARSRIWQRVLEDAQIAKRGLGADLPDHLDALKNYK